MTSVNPPGEDVLQSFGLDPMEKTERLPGGQGTSYRCGDLVLKPAVEDQETNWIADFFRRAPCAGFQLPVPVETDTGSIVHSGWQAWKYIPGEHRQGSWPEKIELCKAFHDAISEMPRPGYFETRDENPWVVADRVTWDEQTIKHHHRIEPWVELLRSKINPVSEPSQLIHGDFGGNILFQDNALPAVIDFSPYWRPAPFAAAVVVVDAIVWEGADPSLIEAVKMNCDFHQYLLRAEMRRIIELETIAAMHGREVTGQIKAHMQLIRTLTETE